MSEDGADSISNPASSKSSDVSIEEICRDETETLAVEGEPMAANDLGIMNPDSKDSPSECKVSEDPENKAPEDPENKASEDLENKASEDPENKPEVPENKAPEVPENKAAEDPVNETSEDSENKASEDPVNQDPEDLLAGGDFPDKAEEDKKDNEAAIPPPPPPTAANSSVALSSQTGPSLEEILDEPDDDDVFEDETLMERLIGLTEMFPEGMASGVLNLTQGSVKGIKWLYGASRAVAWVVFSTATVLFLPVMIETERLGMEEAQKAQQRQILLGPSSAVSAGQNAPLPKAPV